MTALRLPDGRLLVVDGASQELRAFRRDGTLDWTTGGRGEAPGEFGEITWAGLASSGRVAVWDTGSGRATLLAAATAEVVSTDRLPGVGFLSRILGRFSDGSYLARHQTPRSPAGSESSIPTDATLARVRPGPEAVSDTIVTIPGRPLVDLGGVISPAPLTADPLAVVVRDTVYVVPAGLCGFEARVPGEGLTMSVETGGARGTVTDSVVRAYEERELARWSDPASRRRMAQMLDDVPYPEELPCYDRMLAGDAGRIWLRRFDARGEGPRTWDVFATGGERVALVETPAGLFVTDVGEDRVLGIWRDELDVEYVHGYALEPRGP